VSERGSVRVERDGPLASLVLDRPEKRNALTGEMLARIRDVLAGARADREIRVLLLRGEGLDFCAGLDLTTVDAGEAAEDRMEREEADLFAEVLALRDHPTPTVAVVQGACIAAGLLLSQACDLVVASEDASFYNPLARMGGVGLEVLFEPWDIGVRRAKRHLFTGERIPADLALRLGMVTDVVPRAELVPAATALARRIAAMPPVALRLLKRSLNRTQDLMGMRNALEYHFALHEFGHGTEECRRLLHEARRGRPLREFFARRDEGPDPADPPAGA